MRYRQAKYDPRPERKNCMAEIKLKQQIWIGIHKSGPILLMLEHVRYMYDNHSPFRDQLGWKFRTQKAHSPDCLSQVLRVYERREVTAFASIVLT